MRRQELVDGIEDNRDSDDNPFERSPSHDSDVTGTSESDGMANGTVDPDQVSDLDLSNPEIDDEDEIDSDDAFEDGDEHKFKDFSFRDDEESRGVPLKPRILQKKCSKVKTDASTTNSVSDASSEAFGTLDDVPIVSSDDDESSNSESDSHSSSSNTSEPPILPKAAAPDRASLRKLMASEQKSVVANLSRETAADISKGKAVAQQQQTFSTLLNCRIRLQKALTMTRDLKELPSLSDDAMKESAAIVESAQLASLKLWNSLNSLRASLHKNDLPTSKAQEATETVNITTPRSQLLSKMQSFEAISIPTRRATLSKWAIRTAPPSTLPSRNKFSNSSSQTPFLSVLDSHLSESNMTSQLSKSYTSSDTSNLLSRSYDDTSFYATLLRDLVSQKASSTSLANPNLLHDQNLPLSNALPKAAKQHRANLDTKASKGRKMRYTVHEKLQNFMPREDRGTWGDRQVAELFGGLLGRKVQGGLEEGDDDENSARGGDEENEDESELQNGHGDGFRLFGT